MPKDSSISTRVIFLDREAITGQLNRALEDLAEQRPEVRQVWLFGSFSRDRSAPGSDLDLALLLSGPDDRPWPERTGTYLPYFRELSLPVDLFCYTLAEWDASRQLPFFAQIAQGRRLLDR